jgi:hypothetical protein
MVQHLLTKTEIAFLSGSREFTKPQARCIRCRLNKKLRTLSVELAYLQQLNQQNKEQLNDEDILIELSNRTIFGGLRNLRSPEVETKRRRR